MEGLSATKVAPDLVKASSDSSQLAATSASKPTKEATPVAGEFPVVKTIKLSPSDEKLPPLMSVSIPKPAPVLEIEPCPVAEQSDDDGSGKPRKLSDCPEALQGQPTLLGPATVTLSKKNIPLVSKPKVATTVTAKKPVQGKRKDEMPVAAKPKEPTTGDSPSSADGLPKSTVEVSSQNASPDAAVFLGDTEEEAPSKIVEEVYESASEDELNDAVSTAPEPGTASQTQCSLSPNDSGSDGAPWPEEVGYSSTGGDNESVASARCSPVLNSSDNNEIESSQQTGPSRVASEKDDGPCAAGGDVVDDVANDAASFPSDAQFDPHGAMPYHGAAYQHMEHFQHGPYPSAPPVYYVPTVMAVPVPMFGSSPYPYSHAAYGAGPELQPSYPYTVEGAVITEPAFANAAPPEEAEASMAHAADSNDQSVSTAAGTWQHLYQHTKEVGYILLLFTPLFAFHGSL